jgi:LCP family protein required for cell wall assembly
LKRRSVYVAVGVALALCVGLPTAGFAGYNLLYFVREQLHSDPTPSPFAVTLVPSSTATPTPECGGPPAMLILLIGSDSRADSYSAGLADSVRIVRVDFVNPSLTYLVFLRDLYVEIPGISSHGGITHGKLNQAYLYGNPGFGYYDGPGQGPGLLALTLLKNFGARSDHYVAVNLQAFTRIINQLGGLDINLPYTVDGRAARSRDRDRYFPASQLHLNGYRTMLLARMRPNGDLERSRTQNLILQALAFKLLTPQTLPKLPALVETLYNSVQTDLGPNEIAELLCLSAKMDSGDIQPLSFPDELLTASRINDPVLGSTFIWDADVNQLRKYVNRFNEGTWPDVPSGAPNIPMP